MSSMYKTPRWVALRAYVVKRDRWICKSCGKVVRGKGQSRVDHIIPVSKDPAKAWDPSNLRTLCAACDNARHAEKGGHHKERPMTRSDGYPEDWGQR
jgi:5-methylcytosine-specific restriction protein A